jgi:hypothetical protein
MAKTLMIVIALVVIFLILKPMLWPGKETPAAKYQRVVQNLKLQADAHNGWGPTHVNAWTVLDKTTVGPGARLTYFFTLLGATAKSPVKGLEDMEEGSGARIKLCGQASSRKLLDDGAVYEYIFRDQAGGEVGHFEIGKEDCK